MASPKSFSGTKRVFEDMPTVTIPVGQTISSAVDIQGANICGIILPEGLTAANIQFGLSDSKDGDYILATANDTSSPPIEKVFQITIPSVLTAPTTIPASQLAAGRWFPVKPSDFAGAQYIKLLADTAQLTNPAIFTLITRGTPV